MEQRKNKDKDMSKMIPSLSEVNKKIIQKKILLCVKIMK